MSTNTPLPSPRLSPTEEVEEITVEATHLMDWPKFALVGMIALAVINLLSES